MRPLSLFALVAQRGLEPGSELAGTKWVAERVAIEGSEAVTGRRGYAAMNFLLDALGDIAAEVFASVALMLHLDLDIVFVDMTSTYFELDVPDDLAELEARADDDGPSRPVELGKRPLGLLQGLPHRPAAGRDRDGRHPRRGAGAVLYLHWEHRRHRDHPHRLFELAG